MALFLHLAGKGILKGDSKWNNYAFCCLFRSPLNLSIKLFKVIINMVMHDLLAQLIFLLDVKTLVFCAESSLKIAALWHFIIKS